MTYNLLIVAVITVVTIILRFLPFWIFGEKRKTPKIITNLGNFLPFACMGMLVVYCLKDVDFTATPYGLPEFISCTIIALLQVWKRNSMLSIGVGTAVYMLLVQLVF